MLRAEGRFFCPLFCPLRIAVAVDKSLFFHCNDSVSGPVSGYRKQADGRKKLWKRRELRKKSERTIASLGKRPDRKEREPNNADVHRMGEHQVRFDEEIFGGTYQSTPVGTHKMLKEKRAILG